MKEATGEANMTIITVVLIALVVAVATPLIRNALNSNANKTDCLNRGCYYVQGNCYTLPPDDSGNPNGTTC